MDDRAIIRNLIKTWYQRARRSNADPVSKFVFLWFCMNAWLAFESQMDRDADMLRWLKQTSGSPLRTAYAVAYKSETFRGQLSALAKSPISDVRVRRPNPDVVISSIEDFDGIVDGIYRVRCNLFHGGKRADDPRDTKLVLVCSRLLERWVGNLLTELNPAA